MFFSRVQIASLAIFYGSLNRHLTYLSNGPLLIERLEAIGSVILLSIGRYYRFHTLQGLKYSGVNT